MLNAILHNISLNFCCSRWDFISLLQVAEQEVARQQHNILPDSCMG